MPCIEEEVNSCRLFRQRKPGVSARHILLTMLLIFHVENISAFGLFHKPHRASFNFSPGSLAISPLFSLEDLRKTYSSPNQKHSLDAQLLPLVDFSTEITGHGNLPVIHGCFYVVCVLADV